MIANPSSISGLQAEWQAVVQMRKRVQEIANSTFAFNTSTSAAFGDILYNLPFRLAFDVLKKVLLQARNEGLITTSQPRLADLVDSASNTLPWNNWQAIREAVRRRNEVVHGGKLLGDEQCLQDIANVEAQLIAWRIIPTT